MSSSISPLSHYPSKITSIIGIIVTISDERPCCAPPPCWRSHNPRWCRLTTWTLPHRPCKRCQRDDGEDNVVCCLFWTFLCGKNKKCCHFIYCQCCYLANDETKWNFTFSASLLCFEFWAIFFRMMMKLKLVFKFRLVSNIFYLNA